MDFSDFFTFFPRLTGKQLLSFLILTTTFLVSIWGIVIFLLRSCRLLSSQKGMIMKKAIILEIVVTKTQILPYQFDDDIWRTARKTYRLTPEVRLWPKAWLSCFFFPRQRLRNCDNQTSNSPVVIWTECRNNIEENWYVDSWETVNQEHDRLFFSWQLRNFDGQM